ncbi:MAG: hypothetical protein WCB68_09440 [Pyrinomonadaceae bacterium]
MLRNSTIRTETRGTAQATIWLHVVGMPGAALSVYCPSSIAINAIGGSLEQRQQKSLNFQGNSDNRRLQM